MPEMSTPSSRRPALAAVAGLLLWAAPVHGQHDHAPAGAPTATEHAEHAAREPPHAEITQAERAAAFPELAAAHMGEMMIEDPLNKLVLLDRFEWHDAADEDLLSWDLDAWIGHDLTKLWIRSEGEQQSGHTGRAELELLWGKGFARWWELLAGARADFAPGSDQGWAAVGVRGLAPYRFEIEATAYVGDGGRSGLRVETAYELLVTNRLILQPLLELDWYGQADPERLRGTGLNAAELGLRLRYELRREIAPYIGLTRERSFGQAADLKRAASHEVDDTRLVAGIRLWF